MTLPLSTFCSMPYSPAPLFALNILLQWSPCLTIVFPSTLSQCDTAKLRIFISVPNFGLILLSHAFTPFNTQSPSLLQTSESLAPVCPGHITSLNCPKSLSLLPPLPRSFLLISRRQVAIIPSGDENSHCSPLSHSNNIMCLIKRWQRRREWGLTS